jgi:hypothetical protein
LRVYFKSPYFKRFLALKMTGTTVQEPPAKVVEQAIEQELRLEDARPKS